MCSSLFRTTLGFFGLNIFVGFISLFLCSASAAGQTIETPSLAKSAVAPTPTPTPTPTASPTPEVSDEDEEGLSAPPTGQTAPSDQDSQNPAPKEKRGSWILAPIPISSPTFGNGLVVGVGYVFNVDPDDKVSPPSTIGGGLAFTGNGSRGFALGAGLRFSENKYDSTTAFLKGKALFRYHPIGSVPGAPDLSILVKISGDVFFQQFSRNVWKDVFIGPRFQYRDLKVGLEGIQIPGGYEIPEIEFKSKTAAIGFAVFRDKRDNSFYPTKGSYWQVTGDFFVRKKFLGINRNYEIYRVSYNGYHSIGKKQVLAYRGTGCAVSDRTPFYDLCSIGGTDLRGYATGQFQNRRMFAGQVEYRRELPWRFGVVGFAGVGGIARRVNEFRFKELLPAVGAGIRFKLNKSNHINYRVDVGYGRAGYTVTLSVLEAF